MKQLYDIIIKDSMKHMLKKQCHPHHSFVEKDAQVEELSDELFRVFYFCTVETALRDEWMS